MRLLLLPLALLLAGCRADAPAPTSALAPRPLAHATGFRLLEAPAGYTVAEITRAYPGQADTLRYALVPRGAPDSVRAAVPPDMTTIATPVQRVAALSTTFLALLDRAGASPALVAVGGGPWVNTLAVRAGLDRGRIADLGAGEAVDAEALLAAEPDVVLLDAVGGPGETYRTLEAAGVPTILVGDWTETHPLGRMEWVVLMGALVGREAQARAYADSVAGRYERLRSRQAGQRARTRVISGAAWQGTWHVPGGQSFLAALIRDAGGTYPWIDTDETGSLALDLETVLAEASDARVWIGPGSAASLRELRRADERYLALNAVQTGRVFGLDGRVSAGGGLDFYETAVAEPDVLLADLIKTLHTGSLPDHTLTYLRRLPPR